LMSILLIVFKSWLQVNLKYRNKNDE